MLSRRTFLRDSLAVVSLGLGVPGVFSKAVALAAEENSLSLAGKTLVVVQLAGGVDCLDTVVPYTNPAHRSLRPTLGLPEDDLLVIDGDFAFHPSLAALKGLFDAGKLAVVQGVGYPEPNFSHFKAMDIWQSADPAGVARDGWLGRYFDGLVDAGGHPLAGLSVGRSLPDALQARKAQIPSIGSVETFALQGAGATRETSLLQLYDLYSPADTPFAALLDATLDSAVSSSAELAAAHAVYTTTVAYPESSLSSGLRLLAELIDMGGRDGSPLRVGHVSLGGFDTHTQQPQRLAALLTQTSEALAAFWQDIEQHGHSKDVIVMTWSEFGRRPRENAQAGTDHGSAGLMFLLGDSIKGGFHGAPPSLTDLDDGNLRYTTDFRSVYATVLEDWLQAPADALLNGRFDRLDLIAT